MKMTIVPIYFTIEELVCKDVFTKFGKTAWQFFDPRLLITMDWLRQKLNKPIYVNSWDSGGTFDERGLRCIQCPLVKEAIVNKTLYVSPHMLGQGIDFDVQGMEAEEVRQWLKSNAQSLPFSIRLEDGVHWVHLDIRETNQKVYIFNP